MNKYILVNLYSRVLLKNKKLLIHVTMWIFLKKKKYYVGHRKPDTEDYILNDSCV